MGVGDGLPGLGVVSLEAGRACTEKVEEGRRGLEILPQLAVIAKAGKFKKESHWPGARAGRAAGACSAGYRGEDPVNFIL